jgi:hypothetical protein
MDERRRRQWAAAEARELGRGGVTAVARATGLSRTTITAGLRELKLPSRRRAELADELRILLVVCHFPPGTSKWNKIEHRLFSFIMQNWRGRPLVSHETIVSLIAKTTTKAGLTVKAALDTNPYETAIKVSDEEMAHVRLTPHLFHGDWNYTIAPRR